MRCLLFGHSRRIHINRRTNERTENGTEAKLSGFGRQSKHSILLHFLLSRFGWIHFIHPFTFSFSACSYYLLFVFLFWLYIRLVSVFGFRFSLFSSKIYNRFFCFRSLFVIRSLVMLVENTAIIATLRIQKMWSVRERENKQKESMNVHIIIRVVSMSQWWWWWWCA